MVAIKELRPSAWPVLALATVAAAFHLSYAAYGNLTQDEAWLLECAARVGSGQIAHRDFVSIYPPGQFHLAAWVLDLAGGDARAVRWMWAILRGIVVGLTFAVGRRLMPPAWALAAALAVLAMPGPWHKTFYALVPLAVFWAAARAQERDSRAWLVISGAAAGLGFWFRHDVALFAFGVAGLLPLVRWLSLQWASREIGAAATGFPSPALPRERVQGEGCEGSIPRTLVDMTLVGVGSIVAASLLGLYLVGGIDPWLWIEQLFVRAMQEGHSRLRWVGLMRASGGWPSALLPLAALATTVAWLVYLVIRLVRGGWSTRHTMLFGLALFSLLAANQIVRVSMVARFLQGGPTIFVLWFAALAGLHRWCQRRARSVALPVVMVAAGAPLVLAAALFNGWQIGLPAEYAGTAALRWTRRVPFELPHGGTIYVEPHWSRTVGRLQQVVERLPDANGPIVVFGWPAGLLHLTQRSNPTRLIRFEDLSVTPAERDEALATMMRNCRFVVVHRGYFDRQAKAWWPLLQRHFRQRWAAGPHQVWERKPSSDQR